MNINIDSLIAKYLAGETNLIEDEDLNHWLNNSEDNRKYFLQLKNVWNTHNKIEVSKDIALKKTQKLIRDQSNIYKFWKFWQKIASILIIPILFAWLIHVKIDKNKQNINFKQKYTVTAPFGTFTSLILPDSTKVWLNSGSKISYPAAFDNKLRKVELEGEAYFEVKSDQLHPFIVSTSKFDVKATGTKFNVRAYKQDKTPQIALAEGKISINSLFYKNFGNVTLKPNQIFIINTENTQKIARNDVDIYKYYAWKDGKLIFRNDSFDAIAERISIQYNTDIELVGEKIRQYRFRATFKNESLEEVLNLLKISTPFVFKTVYPKRLQDGTFTKKKIIISSK